MFLFSVAASNSGDTIGPTVYGTFLGSMKVCLPSTPVIYAELVQNYFGNSLSLSKQRTIMSWRLGVGGDGSRQALANAPSCVFIIL